MTFARTIAATKRATAPPTQKRIRFNFRETENFGAANPDQDAVFATHTMLYPVSFTTGNGVSVDAGMINIPIGLTSIDYNATLQPELRGIVFRSNNNLYQWRVDITGVVDFNICVGYEGSNQEHQLEVFDGAYTGEDTGLFKFGPIATSAARWRTAGRSGQYTSAEYVPGQDAYEYREQVTISPTEYMNVVFGGAANQSTCVASMTLEWD